MAFFSCSNFHSLLKGRTKAQQCFDFNSKSFEGVAERRRQILKRHDEITVLQKLVSIDSNELEYGGIQ